MSTLALPPVLTTPGRHRSTTSMSSTTWGRVRAVLTATVVVAATASGIVVGLDGAAVSPVSVTATTPAATTPLATAPAATTPPATTTDRGTGAAAGDGPRLDDLARPGDGGHHR